MSEIPTSRATSGSSMSAAASNRDVTPIFAKAAERCDFTVLSETQRRRAISALPFPSTASRSAGSTSAVGL